MAPLTTDLRNQLARAIQTARCEAEAGARKALESLAVHLGKAHDSMGAADRELRGRLRAHGRQEAVVTEHPRRGVEPRARSVIMPPLAIETTQRQARMSVN